MKTLLENEYHKLELENGIVIATWKANLIDLPIAKKMLAGRKDATNGQKYPFLIKMRSLRECTKEAREYYAAEGMGKDYVAGAVHVESIIESFIANFFIQVNKPLANFKIFNDEAKAKKWLEQFVEKN